MADWYQYEVPHLELIGGTDLFITVTVYRPVEGASGMQEGRDVGQIANDGPFDFENYSEIRGVWRANKVPVLDGQVDFSAPIACQFVEPRDEGKIILHFKKKDVDKAQQLGVRTAHYDVVWVTPGGQTAPGIGRGRGTLDVVHSAVVEPLTAAPTIT